MVIFHFCYDLEYFKIYNFHISSNPFFLYFRIVIVSLFLFVVGVSLTLSHKSAINWQKVKKRAITLFSVAFAISVVTYFIFPYSWVYFGIIHFIALASLLGLFFIDKKALALFVALAILLLYFLGFLSMSPIFKAVAPLLHLPVHFTQDLVPLIPWFSVVLLGIALSDLLLSFCQKKLIQTFTQQLKIVNFLGKHALSIYLVHQIVLFALFFIILSIIS